MAKYYYCPLYLPASMRQPGTIVNQAGYQPGLTDAVTLETTSAVAALTAAGVNLSLYSGLHGSLTALPCLLTGQIPIFGPQNQPPSSNSKSNLMALASQAPTNFQAQTDASTFGTWPIAGFEQGNTSISSFNSGGQVDHDFGPTPPDMQTQPSGGIAQNIERTTWARTPILYVDISRRMVIETPDAFVDGPFLAAGWIEKQWWEVNMDYPLTIQGFPATGQNPYKI